MAMMGQVHPVPLHRAGTQQQQASELAKLALTQCFDSLCTSSVGLEVEESLERGLRRQLKTIL